MTTKTIYIYDGVNGRIQTPVELPITAIKTMTRLIADDGMMLVNGDVQTTCIDVDNQDVGNWKEIKDNRNQSDKGDI